MKRLRDSMKWIFIAVIVVFVGSMIFQRGMGDPQTRRNDGQKPLATVDGKEIEQRQYSVAVENAINRARRNQQEITAGLVSQLSEQTWQELINRELIQSELSKKEVSVLEDEILAEVRVNPPDILKQQPSFQTNGRFDYNLFAQYAQSPNADMQFLQGLESMMKDNLTSAKLQNLVSSMSFVTRHAAIEEIFQSSTKVKARYKKYALADYKADLPAPSDDQLKRYFEENKSKYSKEQGAILDYVFMPIEILERDSLEAKSQIDTIYYELTTGGDFTDIATRFSQDPSVAQNNGRLGWVTKGRLVPEFEEVIFAMDSGEVSEPFLTQYGWHIAKVEGINDSLEAVLASHILINIKPGYETTDSLSRLAEEVQSTARLEGLERTARDLGLMLETTGIIDEGERIPGVGFHTLVNNFALNDTVGAVYDAIAMPDGYYVYQIKKQFKAGEASFDNVKPIVKEDYLDDMAKNLAYQDAMSDYDSAEGTLEGMDADTTAFTSAYTFNPNVGYDPVFIGALLGAPLEKLTKPFDGANEDFYLLEVIERENPTNDDISGQINMVYSEIQAQNNEQAFNRWFKAVKKRSDIEDNRLELWRR